MTTKNIAITSKLMQYMRDEGYDTGLGLSRERTIHGDSWREWFSTKAGVDEVIRIFTSHDSALRYEGIQQNKHVILNGDRRMCILLERNEDRGYTSVWVRYRPDRWSYEKSI